MRAILFTVLTLVFLSSSIQAQEVSELSSQFSIDESEVVAEAGIFNNSKSLFIDFENLDHLPTTFKVLDENKEVVYSENLLDLPEDSIYEFDLENLDTGVYSLQILTYKHTIHKQLDIN